MMFVDVASKYDAEILVSRCDNTEKVNAKALMQMMLLAATQGTDLLIEARGDDALDAIKDLVALVKSNFSEE